MENIKDLLNKYIVSFSYKKLNGEWREAEGTRNSGIIEESGGEFPKGTGKEPDEDNITYYDTKVGGWRMFKEANLITINKYFE